MTSSSPGTNLIADTMAVVLWLEQRRRQAPVLGGLLLG